MIHLKYVALTCALMASLPVTWAQAGGAPPTPSALAGTSCASETRLNDERCDMGASFYLGLAVDTFASGEVRRYLNPQDANGKAERMIGGIDFGYRLASKSEQSADKTKNFYTRQLWVYGETVHGARSAEIDCGAHPEFAICKVNLKPADFVTDPTGQLIYLLRNASSLEGFLGLRYEFLPFNKEGSNPATLYFKAQAGFLKVIGSPDSAAAMHHVGFGVLSTKGDFGGSYLEVGYGRSDIFQFRRRRRAKVDGYLERKISDGISAFAQLTVDTDLGYGPDAMQSYFGVNFDLRNIRGWFKPTP